MKLIKILEDIWDNIVARINNFFDSNKLAHYMLVAYDVERRISSYLDEKKIKYVILIEDATEYYRWVKVSVDVYVEIEPYEKVMELWEVLDRVGREGINILDNKGIYISVEPLEFLRKGIK